ncbi:hypothetical protein BKA62DRAFT_646158 [Auriculariales sp. MPI-PUGE-AT-0066]|nr:hypothetical protein BKA62DRAFT_646158 [Auriculariales sp. MPI-PUGE-AT-0066]
MSGAPEASVLRAATFYEKKPGILELNATTLQWTPDGNKVPIIQMKRAEIGGLKASLAGTPQAKIKVSFLNPEDGSYNLTFRGPIDRATRERDMFKDELARIMSRNKARIAQKAKQAASVPATPAPNSRLDALGPQLSERERVLRLRVLEKNAELRTLHAELVIRDAAVDETEFWASRRQLLDAELSTETQRRGKAGPLVEIQPQAADGKVSLNPQRIKEIFDAYPILKKIHDESVMVEGAKVTKEQFWKRYFQSKLFDSHRSTIRTSATQHVVKGDPLFDQYLEPDDDQLEPRRQNAPPVDLLLDIAASREDHRDTGNTPDITMQAGKTKAILPLIRRFNAHSEQLLTSALGERPPEKRRRLDEDDLAEIDLPDLRGGAEDAGIALVMKDRRRYYEARSSAKKDGDEVMRVDVGSIVREMQIDLGGWARNLSSLRPSPAAATDAFQRMTDTVAGKNSMRHIGEIPPALMQSVKVLQTSSNELLRQYWCAVYPSGEENTLGSTNPAQRTMRADKMVGYLSNTQQKIEDLTRHADSPETAQKIRTVRRTVIYLDLRALTEWLFQALSHLLQAVEHAVYHYNNIFAAKSTAKPA